jgi:hypothetical protein
VLFACCVPHSLVGQLPSSSADIRSVSILATIHTLMSSWSSLPLDIRGLILHEYVLLSQDPKDSLNQFKALLTLRLVSKSFKGSLNRLFNVEIRELPWAFNVQCLQDFRVLHLRFILDTPLVVAPSFAHITSLVLAIGELSEMETIRAFLSRKCLPIC